MRYPNIAPPKTYALDFPNLTGGMNTAELEYRLKPNETPFAVNMWWKDGILQSRYGAKQISDICSAPIYSCYEHAWHGSFFIHAGEDIYRIDATQGNVTFENLGGVVKPGRGTFFRYFDKLYYKNKGSFNVVTYNDGKFSVSDVQSSPYMPIIQINTKPGTGAGDLYQPENRLTPYKRVWFTAESGATVYHLPIKNINDVPRVVVDGVIASESLDYAVDTVEGTVTFKKPPAVSDPPVPNTVEITFSKIDENSKDAGKAILDCRYAFVAGGDRNICIIFAGSEAQPNAVFWNANDDLSMNPTYWPIDAYNLVGATDERVTGFGSQYKDTIVFKEHTVGRLDFNIDDIGGRKIPSFLYTQINDRVGCDLPWSIQLIENNLVFANTYQGVHILRSSSPAYENNIQSISGKVNEPCKITEYRDDPGGAGLLNDVRTAQEDTVCSFDDDSRYWLCANGVCYTWDYTISGKDDPSWFQMVGLSPVSWALDSSHKSYFVTSDRAYTLTASYKDDSGHMEKIYRTPATDFGVSDYLKDVVDATIVTQAETDSKIKIKYITDLEERFDLTDIRSWIFAWQGMNLGKIILGAYNVIAPRYSIVSRRKPMCRHIKYFAIELRDIGDGDNMGIVSAQVKYRLAGKER